MTLFICTAGTSIAGGPMKPEEDEPAFRARVDAKLRQQRSELKRSAFLIRVSAETNGLAREGAGAGDQVMFLATETDDGRIAADCLARFVEAEFGCRASARVVDGLQVRDGVKFRTAGVRGLFDALDELRRDFSDEEIRLNATGGFKGVMPYVVLYGMFHDLAVSYVYEFSETLITLPRLPVEFDWAGLAPAAQAIFAIDAEGALGEDAWRASLPASYYAGQADFDALFEHEGGLVTLSAVGLLMKARLGEAETANPLFLSLRAHAALTEAHSNSRALLDPMLERLRNPLFRAGLKHAETLHKTDLKVCKRYGKTGPRVLYWVRENHVFVGEVFAHHDLYLAYVNNEPLKIAGYATREFIELPVAVLASPAESVRHLLESQDELDQKLKTLDEERIALKAQLQQAELAKNAEVARATEEARSRGKHEGEAERRRLQSSFQRRLNEKDAEIVGLQEAILSLETGIAEMRAKLDARDHA